MPNTLSILYTLTHLTEYQKRPYNVGDITIPI